MTALLCALFAAFSEAAGPVEGPAPEGRVRVTVRAIAATTEGSGTDQRLAPIAPNLAEFGKDFRYKSYKLLLEKTLDLDWNTAAHLDLPGSRSLVVTPRTLAQDGRIKVHLELIGEYPGRARKLHTDYSIQRGGTLFVGGLRLDPEKPDAGVMLVAVTTQATSAPPPDALVPSEIRATVRPPSEPTPAPPPRRY